MRKVPTTPPGEEPNRFGDMTGYVVGPDEPPTWADALSLCWAIYFDQKGHPNRQIPNKAMIEKALRVLREEHKAGRWSRN